ncbi:hypothetical protein [Thioalkalivibrio sulfidiphilus]|uniref:hypothetical protein n=1 Tax=Thioalkalivibrio sulfidiphilus TaxID=1033854 RepID=UPI003B358FB1
MFLLSEVLSGPLRYVFAQFGLEGLIYVPKALLVVALMGIALLSLARTRMSAVYLGAASISAAGVLWGYVNLGMPSQVLFGLWVLVPFLIGIVIPQAILFDAKPNLSRYVFMLWAIAVFGVFANSILSWPWEGFEYELSGVEIEGARYWRTGGGISIERLAGFSRASFDAANQILVLGTIILVLGKMRGCTIVWLLTGVAITLTTSKTPMAIYLILSMFWLVRRWSPKGLWRSLPVVVAGAGVILPFSTIWKNYDVSSVLDSPLQGVMLHSFGDRLERMWPDTLQMVLNQGNALLGRGVGGIGMAQRYFEPVLYSPADNLALYLFSLLGLIGLLLIGGYVTGLYILYRSRRLPLFVYMGGLIVLLSGLTVNVLESAFLALLFGVTLRYVFGASLQSSPIDSLKSQFAQHGV